MIMIMMTPNQISVLVYIQDLIDFFLCLVFNATF